MSTLTERKKYGELQEVFTFERLFTADETEKVSTVQNREVSTFKRFIFSKNSSGGPRGVHIRRFYCKNK
jgi:hypothetical protein